MSDQNTQSAEKSRKVKRQTGHVTIADLLKAVRHATDPYRALTSIDCRFDKRETMGMKNLVRFAKEHAQKVIDGLKPDHAQLSRTVGLAESVAVKLEDRFDAIMNDSFVVFDKGAAVIRVKAPDILVRDGDKILALQEDLRAKIAGDYSYDEIVDSYKAMMSYLSSVSKDADAAAKAERTRQSKLRQASQARELLAELDGLDDL